MTLQIPLAVMETESENKNSVMLFWTLFNEVLQKVSNSKSAKFNPVGFCTDMAGANLSGIKEVFGEEATATIKSCEFHFKEHRNRMSRRLDDEDADEFKRLCNELLECVTPEAYERAKGQMDNVTSECESRGFLTSWINWWHDRRGFIFRAFSPSGGPSMNQAEVIHAGWAHRDEPNLSLLDACHADVHDSLQVDVELKSLESGAGPVGSGPSYMERKNRQHNREIKKAQQLGKEMLANETDGMRISPNSKHRPPPRKQKKPSKNATVSPMPSIDSITNHAMHLNAPNQATAAHHSWSGNQMSTHHNMSSYQVSANVPGYQATMPHQNASSYQSNWPRSQATAAGHNAPSYQSIPATHNWPGSQATAVGQYAPSYQSIPATHNWHRPQATAAGQYAPSYQSIPARHNWRPSQATAATNTTPRNQAIAATNTTPRTQAIAATNTTPRNQATAATNTTPRNQAIAATNTTPRTQATAANNTPRNQASNTNPPGNRKKAPTPASGVFELRFLQDCPSLVSVCFGCGQALKPGGVIGNPPYDLVVVSRMPRQYIDQSGKRHQSRETNVYFHALTRCIKQKQPYFANLTIPMTTEMALKPEHKQCIDKEFKVTFVGL